MPAPLLVPAFARLAMLLLAPASGAPAAAVPPREGTIVFGGDVVPHGDLMASFQSHGAASLCAPIAPVVRAADLAFANFETPLAPSRPISNAHMRFNVHEDFGRALFDAGFDGVSVANNHAYDAGIAQVGETVTTLRGIGLRPIGGAVAGEDPYAPQEFSLAGGTLCVFAATRLLNYWLPTPTAATARVALARPAVPAEEDALVAAIARHRARCGAVVVSLHTGIEYQDHAEPRDRAFFRRVAQAGADAVIGHHSHTPHPVQLYDVEGRQVPVFESLGNLVSNQGARAESLMESEEFNISLDPRLREGLLAVLRFEATADGRLRVAEFGYVPLWTVNTRMTAPSHEAPTISAALMPRDGGGDRLLGMRWRGLVARVGERFLLPAASLPGGAEAQRVSDAAVLAARRALHELIAARASRRAGSLARSQR